MRTREDILKEVVNIAPRTNGAILEAVLDIRSLMIILINSSGLSKLNVKFDPLCPECAEPMASDDPGSHVALSEFKCPTCSKKEAS